MKWISTAKNQISNQYLLVVKIFNENAIELRIYVFDLNCMLYVTRPIMWTMSGETATENISNELDIIDEQYSNWYE